MEEIKIVEICEKVLTRLSEMGYESKGNASSEKLIFPMKIQAEGTKEKDRVSEQELRFLFVEQFKIKYPQLYYSVETPTKEKYKFGKIYEDIGVNKKGQSALIDMCMFEKEKEYYKRILNIEFKHKNAALKNIAKDVLKLMHEEQDGAFILLLKNTNKGTLCNNGGTGVLDKLSQSFTRFKEVEKKWKGNDKKHIQLIILSLEQKTNTTEPAVLIHRKINKNDNLDDVFSIGDIGSVAITKESKEGKWGKLIIDKN